jgi:hypothetical protein
MVTLKFYTLNYTKTEQENRQTNYLRRLYQIMVKKIKLIFLLLLLSGCVDWETEEVKISLNKEGGNIEIIFGPLVSDKRNAEEREADFAYLLYDGIEKDTTGSPYVKDVKGRFEEKEGNLFGYISGGFDNLDALNALKEDFNIMLFGGSKLIYKPEIGATILRTNGTVSKGESGNIIISWRLYADRRIEYKIGKKVEYPAESSLLPEYKKYLKDEDYFRNLYINLKLKEGRELLKRKEFKDAYGSFSDVLRIDPKNSTASEEIKKLP